MFLKHGAINRILKFDLWPAKKPPGPAVGAVLFFILSRSGNHSLSTIADIGRDLYQSIASLSGLNGVVVWALVR